MIWVLVSMETASSKKESHLIVPDRMDTLKRVSYQVLFRFQERCGLTPATYKARLPIQSDRHMIAHTSQIAL